MANNKPPITNYGPQVAEILPETLLLSNEVLAWLKATIGNAAGRDYFGVQHVELVWEAGQLVEWRGPGFKRR
jgi:hypothetical protein